MDSVELTSLPMKYNCSTSVATAKSSSNETSSLTVIRSAIGGLLAFWSITERVIDCRELAIRNSLNPRGSFPTFAKTVYKVGCRKSASTNKTDRSLSESNLGSDTPTRLNCDKEIAKLDAIVPFLSSGVALVMRIGLQVVSGLRLRYSSLVRTDRNPFRKWSLGDVVCDQM